MNQDNEPQPTDDAPTAAPAFSAAPTPEDGSDAGIPIARKSRRGPVLAIVVATASVVCIGGLGTAAIAVLTEPAASTTSSQSTSGGVGTQRGSGYGSFSDPNGNGFSGRGGAAFGGGISGGSSSSGTGASVSAATASTAAEKVGVVTIDTVLNYDSQERAAGTGMIMSSNGLILTNNHVVQQATRITVTVESTGKSYRATVVGTDATDDVAVLKLSGASGLTPVTFDASSSVKAGAAVYSVGNAEGTGDLVTAKGTVEAVNQSLTVQSDFSETGESLSGLIEVSSDVVSGDSGGPLRDSSGDVIGIITAASSGSSAVTGYAINIDKALRIADQIESGTASSTVRIGYRPSWESRSRPQRHRPSRECPSAASSPACRPPARESPPAARSPRWMGPRSPRRARSAARSRLTTSAIG